MPLAWAICGFRMSCTFMWQKLQDLYLFTTFLSFTKQDNFEPLEEWQ